MQPIERCSRPVDEYGLRLEDCATRAAGSCIHLRWYYYCARSCEECGAAPSDDHGLRPLVPELAPVD